MDPRNNTIEMFLDLMQQQLDEIKKAPTNLPDLWGFDNLINSNRKLLEAYQLYEAYQRDRKKLIKASFECSSQLTKDEFYDLFSSDHLNDARKNYKREHKH